MRAAGGPANWRAGPTIATHAKSAVRLLDLGLNDDGTVTAEYALDSLHEAWFTQDVGRAAEDGIYALRFSLDGFTIREIERKKLRSYGALGSMAVPQ